MVADAALQARGKVLVATRRNAAHARAVNLLLGRLRRNAIKDARLRQANWFQGRTNPHLIHEFVTALHDSTGDQL